jgi:hypothetical protein
MQANGYLFCPLCSDFTCHEAKPTFCFITFLLKALFTQVWRFILHIKGFPSNSFYPNAVLHTDYEHQNSTFHLKITVGIFFY